MRSLIKKYLLTLVALTMFSGCMVRTVAGFGADINCEIETYPVESGIGDEYGPNKMLSYCVGYKDGLRRDFIKVVRPKN